MPDDERRLELEKRRQMVGYPRRAKAKFTAENDHNPLILQDCPECHGSGKRDRRSAGLGGGQIWSLGSCEACAGVGITGNVEAYFTSDISAAAPVAATPDADGWLRCPGCRIVFTTRDADRWTGYRHIRCGQRIPISSPISRRLESDEIDE
jgi:hypothetical protein